MKQIVLGMAAALIAGLGTAVCALAAEPACARPCPYVDVDGDGVCDSANCPCGPAAGNGPGGRGAYGKSWTGPGYGAYFVDADGDGICDYRSGDRAGQGNGFRGVRQR